MSSFEDSTQHHASFIAKPPKKESNAAQQKATRISHACQMCKIRKTRCDGKNPCWRCTTRQTECSYDSSDRRRARSILLKDFNVIRENMKTYDKLMELMRSSNDECAQHALELIRSRSSVKEIVDELERIGVDSSSPCSSQDTIMIDGKSDDIMIDGKSDDAQSPDLIRANGDKTSMGNNSVSPFSKSPITSPEPQSRLSDSAVSSPQSFLDSPLSISTLRPHPTLSKIIGTDGLDILQFTLKDACVAPLVTYRIGSKNWTNVIENDAIVSHLVSLATTWTKSLHLFIDLQAFIEDAAAEDPKSDFCTPVLLNAVLAISCLFCIHEEAFVDPLEPVSRGEHFIAEAKKLLSHARPSTELTMENLTRLQVLPMIALFEASRMRTAAAWYYSTWFFNLCIDLGLPEMPNVEECAPEKWRLGQMAVSYAYFLTERLWFTYTTCIQKLFLSGEPPYSMASLFPTSSIASRRATIGPCSVSALFVGNLNSTNGTEPISEPRTRQNSLQRNTRPSILQMDTEMHNHDARAGQTCRFELDTLIKKLQVIMSSDWDDSTMTDLLMLHGKLGVWLKSTAPHSPGIELDGIDNPSALEGNNALDPCMLKLPIQN